MMLQKLVIVGAGSAMFTQGIVRDWLQWKPAGDWELALVDNKPEILEATARLVRHAVQKADETLKVTAFVDIRDALLNATIVVCTIGVGGRRAWEQDVLIPRQYGILQPVGDSVMPGGISRALRMIPQVLAIAHHVEELCPTARFFNYANPMTCVVRALCKHTKLNVTGLCSGVDETLRYLARYTGVSFESVSARWAGINHCTWIMDMRSNGASLWPTCHRLLAKSPVLRPELLGRMFWDEGWQSSGACREDAAFSWELFAQFGAFPAPMDRHVVEFFPERFRDGRYYGKRLGEGAYSFEACIAHGDRIFNRTMELGKSLDSQSVDSPDLMGILEGESSQLIEILDNIERDRRVWYSVNVPNHGSVTNLPDEAVLELPAVTTSEGFWVPQLGDMPTPLVALVLRRLAAVEATVEAAMTGDRLLAVEALILDGGVSDHDVAVRLTDELIHAQKQYLPQFS
jgi:alpha-galactosidase